MKKAYYLFFALVVALSFQSCDEDNVRVSKTIKKAFSAKYPDAKRVDWEQKGNYFAADFRLNGNDTEALFTSSGEWVMTETEIFYNQLPQAVIDGLQNTEYGKWHVDDIKLIENPSATYYLFDLERAGVDLKLKIDTAGSVLN